MSKPLRATHSLRSQPKSSTLHTEHNKADEKPQCSDAPTPNRGTISFQTVLRNSKAKNEVNGVVPRPLSGKAARKSSSYRALSAREKQGHQIAQYIAQVNAPSELGKSPESLYREHLFQTFQSLKFCAALTPPSVQQLTAKTVHLPRRPGYESKKTLIFDLDETLVHCVKHTSPTPSVVLPIHFPSGDSVYAGLNLRPFARECLREANKHFEVIVFTASHKCYADAVLDHLDPTGELVHHRLYRDHCLVVQGVFVKDLRVLAGRSPEHTVLVDNAVHSFGYQLDSGIPIISWFDDPSDRELFNLMDYMKLLVRANDIRVLNRATFRLHQFYEEYSSEFLAHTVKRVAKITH